MMAKPGYCGTCYGSAAKAGRPVSATKWYDYPVCGLCVGRLSNGLIHWTPSNGSEFLCFQEACFGCLHMIDTPEDPQPTRLEPPFVACAWGVLDRAIYQMISEPDHACMWFDPEDLTLIDGMFAKCQRFTPNDYDGGDRNPPPPQCPGQMTFSDAMESPARPVPAMPKVTP